MLLLNFCIIIHLLVDLHLELRNELIVLEHLSTFDIGFLLPVNISAGHIHHGDGEHTALVKHLRYGSFL